MDEMTVRLRALEDRALLWDLVLRYCVAVDDRDLDCVLRLFAPGAVFTHGDGRVLSEGKEAIGSYYRQVFDVMGPSVHKPYNQLLDDVGEITATGIVQSGVEMALDGRSFRGAMRYYDDYLRADDGWKFARRELRFWYLMPEEEMKQGLAGKLRRRWPDPPSATPLPEALDTWKRYYACD